jgi:hypothetical protein
MNGKDKALEPVEIIANKAIKEQYTALFDHLLFMYTRMVKDKKNSEKFAKKHDRIFDSALFYDDWLLGLLADSLEVEKDVIKFMADKRLKKHNEVIKKMGLG